MARTVVEEMWLRLDIAFAMPKESSPVFSKNDINTLLINFGNYLFTLKTSCFADFYN